MPEAVLDVLLIEDDEDHFVLTRSFLRAEGAPPATLSWVKSRAEALRWLADRHPDVVLADLNLPDSAGLDTVNAVHAAVPDAAVIVWTGLDDEAIGNAAVARGAQDYLVKGAITPGALARSIRHSVERKRAEIALLRYKEHLEDLVHKRTERIGLINESLEREVAERKQIELELRKALSRLQEHDAARSRFVANVSHELKTPLATMSYAIDNLLGGVVGPVGDGFRSYLRMLREDCDRLARTVEDILDVGRSESHTLVLHKAKTPFASLMRRSVAPLYGIAAEKAQSLKLHDGVQAFVDCDAAKMERVIVNIVQNALKYTPEGGRIEVSMRRCDGDPPLVAIDVVDTGVGIPGDCLSRVGERYFRVGNHVSGAGLGLSICRELLELHGGRLEVVSPPPGREAGTQVSAMLPLSPPPRVAVLMADGDAAARLGAALEAGGCAPSPFRSGEQALAFIRAHGPSAVIMTFELEGMDGVEVIARLKSDPAFRHLPLIVLADGMPGGVRGELAEGFHLPVIGPGCTTGDLIEALEKAMMSTS